MSRDNAWRAEREKLNPAHGDTLPAPASSANGDDVLKIRIQTFVPAWGGLRGVALMGPLINHICVDPRARRLGIVLGSFGVTIFFIMFGFLSTCVMYRQLSFKSGCRYAHVANCLTTRFVRLYPALLVLVVSTSFASVIVLGPANLPKTFGNMIANTLLYVANIEPFHVEWLSFWKNTWAVSFQEQFYIIWVFVLPAYVHFKRERPAIFGLLIVLAVIFFSGRIAFVLGYTKTRFFDGASFGGHAWKVIIGAVSPFCRLPRWIMSSSAVSTGLIILILLCVLSFTSQGLLGQQFYMEQPLFEALLIPIGAIGVYAILLGSFNGNAFLESRPVRWIGRISYSWYLYQIPVLMITGWPEKIDHPYRDTFLAFCASLVSTFYIEEPIQRLWKSRKMKKERHHADPIPLVSSHDAGVSTKPSLA